LREIFQTIEVSRLRWRIAQAAELRWWKRYLRRKSVADYTGWKIGYWQDLLSVLGLSPKPHSTVLDAGCGPAGIFTALPYCQVEALDPLLDDYDKLPHFALTEHPHVRWHAIPLESFSAENAFDWVFCLNVINHVRDLDLAIKVLAKAARPDATLVISVDAHRHGWLKPVFRAIPGDILHPHQLDVEEYERLFSRHDLEVKSRKLYREEFLFDYWIFVLQPKHHSA
jgi:2-polyprenyl-6-hydroxyphenyl methylase/3-demethylubiquinone-9 3-methyltransferase